MQHHKKKRTAESNCVPATATLERATRSSGTAAASRAGEMGMREGNGIKSSSCDLIVQVGKYTDVGNCGQAEGEGPRVTPWRRGGGSAHCFPSGEKRWKRQEEREDGKLSYQDEREDEKIP